MASKKVAKMRAGRKKVDPEKKVKNHSTYLTDAEGKIIAKKYGSITQAVRKEILSKV
jgi:hypothetical protein